MKFYYALKGRDGKSGILKATQAEFLAKSVLQCSEKASPEIQQFFKHWKCPVKKLVCKQTKKPNAVIVSYSTRKLSSSELVRFYYALKGRDGESGIVKRLKLKQIARTLLIASPKQTDELKEFFQLWNVGVKLREVDMHE